MRIGTGMVILCACLATGCCCKPQSKEEKAKAAAKSAAAAASREAERQALVTKCGEAWFYDWHTTCLELVREKLFQPKTADFAIFGADEQERSDNCTKTYASTVESMNAFGATIENRFVCSFDTKKNNVKLVYLGR